ncbi:MAG: dihydrolipoamide acetyltransferase component of pyruvate dehydrogenase complex [Candidatus Tectimicrobiota bacterium]|nr:MAG: dihydrolipoamide acetyltransferase component of pyruvate dehydrogenase complex [Candidatus Tectomicrobia bacterium]
MATYAFTLPELGEGIAEGDVVNVLVAVGEQVSKDQPVLELETDKAVIEVPAPVSGIVRAIHVKQGEKAAVGQLLLTLETAEAEAPAATAAPAAPAEPPPPAAVPPPTPPPAPEPAVAAPPAAAAEAEAERPAVAADGQRVLAPAAPSVRRFAREIGIDITEVPGSGPGGRITIEDVKRYARQLHAAGRQGAAVPAVALPDFARWGPIERQPLRGVRQRTAERMAQAWAQVPHVTQFDKADITDLEALRQRYAPRVQAAGGRLTLTAIVLKVVAAALKVFPQFNASLDLARQEVVYKRYYHLGVAVDTEHGLLVPVIRDVDRKNVLTLAVELTQLAERARARKLTPEELQGGTFTVTNLGGLGGTNFTPIVNFPEVAILGLARSQVEPVYRDGTFVPRRLLPLALSYDHRLIDGADGVRFLRWVVEALEQPFLLALEG